MTQHPCFNSIAALLTIPELFALYLITNVVCSLPEICQKMHFLVKTNKTNICYCSERPGQIATQKRKMTGRLTSEQIWKDNNGEIGVIKK